MKKHFYLFAICILIGCSSAKDKSSHAVFTNKKGEQKYIKAYNNTLKLWPVPFEEKDIQTTYGTAHIIISGPAKGEPLVLFHGMDASSTMWYPNIKSYSKKYRVYAVDYILEAGKSKLSDKRPNNEEVVNWYNEVFDALKLNKINLLGTSRGGWLATNYALHNPGRVTKLMLLSPVQTFGLMDMQPKLRKAINFKFFPNRKRLKKLIAAFSYYPDKVGPAFKEQLYLGTEYSKTTFDMLGMAPFKDDVKQLSMPVLVLVGDHDILCGPDVLETATEKVPNITTSIIENAGHFLTIDQQEIVDKKVLDFLGT
jgi:pimeloyl-ACP methyl ester carboxylesterase